MARRQIFAGNWKMYKTGQEAKELVQSIASGLHHSGDREVVVFPPSVYVREIVTLCRDKKIDVGLQNIFYEKEGAFTGEISPLMAADTGVRYVLAGHSERRHVFGETDEDVNKKVLAVFAHSLEPVVCVGELLEERESGKSEDIVQQQVEKAFDNVKPGDMKKAIIAYEPVWAIGTGKVATPEIAESMHSHIRKILKGLYGENISEIIPILYGGSVKPDNIASLFSMKNIDGVLVGGASLKADSFLDIIHVNK